jgi:hypothetical protein
MSSINNVTNKWEKNKIQNFYTSVKNSNREIILEQRGDFTRNTEKIENNIPFQNLINNTNTMIHNDNFIDPYFNIANPNNLKNENNAKYNNKDNNDNTNNNNNDNTNNNNNDNTNNNNNNNRFTELYTENNYIPQNFQNSRDISNERISNIHNYNNQQNVYQDINIFNDNNKKKDFKQANNDRLSRLGQLPNQTAFPLINNNTFDRINTINTR